MSVKVKSAGTRGRGTQRLLAGVKRAKGVKGYKVGWPGSATYPDGTDVAQVALWNEFGVPENSLPERPFFRNANKTFQGRVRNFIKVVQVNGIITATGNERLAQLHVSGVQMSIRDLRDPPNAPGTIAAKGSSNPLIDTGLLRRSVGYEPLK